MNILVIGQLTLQWARLEYGNIGNDYIVEPFFDELHKVFPDAEIRTTFQMTKEFCEKFCVKCVPMDLYYGFTEKDLSIAYKEFALATMWNENGQMPETTPYIEEVLRADMVIDFSGDMWGVNTDIAGDNRFLVGLLKDRVAQLLNKKTAMLAGSPGPFNKPTLQALAKKTFESFDLVTNREPISRSILENYGFKTGHVLDLACPAFIFKEAPKENVVKYLKGTILEHKDRPVIGFTICGWNMLKGPFNRTDWKDDEYDSYVDLIEHIIKEEDVEICLFSHSNGFEKNPFKLIHGRDYALIQQLYNILEKKGLVNRVHVLTGIYPPHIIKGIISQFDMLISGRVHAAVAGLSLNVPTVIIDYGHEPKAHKLRGFAKLCNVEKYVVDPHNYKEMLKVSLDCWKNRLAVHESLKLKIPEVKSLAKDNFLELKNI